MALVAGSQCWQTIPTKLSLAQFEQFVLPHLNTGRVVPHRRWGCTGSSTTSCSCCTWDDSGRRCRSKGMPKVALKSTTRASIGRCGDGRPMVASTRFLRARCASFIRTGCLNSRSSTATARPLPRRRTATTFIGDAPEGVVLPDARAGRAYACFQVGTRTARATNLTTAPTVQPAGFVQPHVRIFLV